MAETNFDFDFVLKEYRALWNNRLLSAGNKSSETVVKEAVKRVLLDENSHPRVRKNRYEKYYLAVKKIVNSSLSPESKVMLIQLHNELLEELNGENQI